ncbi:hypothetical protein DI43_15380 [Geobacillus sp. CAMR12739]|nr:hypothetical protein DI43_15380 [Geobacillus sp. CAMR12739]
MENSRSEKEFVRPDAGMMIKVRDWLQMSWEERFWLLENEAYRQWKNRKRFCLDNRTVRP